MRQRETTAWNARPSCSLKREKRSGMTACGERGGQSKAKQQTTLRPRLRRPVGARLVSQRPAGRPANQ